MHVKSSPLGKNAKDGLHNRSLIYLEKPSPVQSKNSNHINKNANTIISLWRTDPYPYLCKKGSGGQNRGKTLLFFWTTVYIFSHPLDSICKGKERNLLIRSILLL